MVADPIGHASDGLDDLGVAAAPQLPAHVESLALAEFNQVPDLGAAGPREGLARRPTSDKRDVDALEQVHDAVSPGWVAQVQAESKALEVVGMCLQRPLVDVDRQSDLIAGFLQPETEPACAAEQVYGDWAPR